MTHYLSPHAKFTNVEAMDTAAHQHADIHYNAMNKTDRAVLEMIRCYSVKYLAAHLNHETIEKKLNVSNSTVRRSLRKLATLEIIERIQFVRPITNGLGANIYVILPVGDQAGMNSPEKVEKPRHEAVSEVILEKEASFFKSKNNTQGSKTSHLADEELSTTLYSKMKDLLTLTGDISKARELFIIHRSLSGRMLRFEIHQGKEKLFEELAYRATKISVMAKKTKNIRNIAGYFSDVLRQLITDALFEDIHEEYSVSVDDFHLPIY